MATLYRKYRSQRFEDVIGQDPIVTTLTNQIKLDRIGHAYLFTGSRGVGKTSCARIFARAVNCLHPVNGSPCGECEVCKKFAADNVDIIEMDAASNNGVDDARDIREKVKYLPVACKYKVYIIDEVHMLTGGAFNALLKTIEEPPEHVIFILATTEPQKLPQTILSRCIRFDFRLVPTDILAKHIARIYDAEGIKYTAEAVEEIARLGEGSVRDALSVADTLASAAAEITPEIVLSLTGAGDNAAIAKLFDCTASRDLNGVLTVIDGLVKSGKSMPAVCRQLIDYTRNVLVCKSVGKDKAISGGLINADKTSLQAISASADKYEMSEISRILTDLGSAENGLKYSVNPRVFMETALVKTVCGGQREDDI
ncbi:MAG: DNA polymerase III subunit gamma/tau, partial [Clostridiales bacterium]|nr:DNA polymerase III subunit gamma/tau [Clostridiales bacterium]